MADPTIAYIKTLAEEAIAARDLAEDCLPIEYGDYSNKATAAYDKYWNALGKLQPDDFLSLFTALENARKDALEEAAIAAGQACWKHSGDDTYSKGMDAGAIHQTRACVEAIRSLTPPTEKAT